jgi:hypothetical protein
MKTTNNKNESRDSFSEIIRKKLQNYSLPVEEDFWAKIEKRLCQKQKNRIIFFRWVSVTSIAACIAILFQLSFNKKVIHYDNITAKLPHNEETLIASVPETKTHGFRRLPSVQTQPVSVRENPHAGISQPLDFSEPDVIFQENEISEEPEGVIEQVGPNTKPDQKREYFIQDWQEEENVQKHSKKKKRTSLGLHFGSSGKLFASNATPQEDALFEHYNLLPIQNITALSVNLSPYANTILSPEDFERINHSPPLSIGLSVRKELTDYFAIESGLIYTYLRSEFKHRVPYKDAKSELYYLGVPVNLVFAFIPPHRSKRWDVYISAGGMMEKGLVAHYKQNTYQNNVAGTIASNERIAGIQWSLQVNLGAAYKLNKEYSLFLEPKAIYYLNNNQPFNIRTERPWAFGVTTGIRYTW